MIAEEEVNIWLGSAPFKPRRGLAVEVLFLSVPLPTILDHTFPPLLVSSDVIVSPSNLFTLLFDSLFLSYDMNITSVSYLDDLWRRRGFS